MPIRPVTVVLLLVFSFWSCLIVAAEPQRATRLGNPATRFADPLKTPEDLRSTLLKESLQADVLKILRMSEYLGDIEDFRRAVANAEITPLSIPPGSVLPAMSTRNKGKVDLLRNVLWAGKKPIDAYEFTFISGDRRYRVVTPKACSNFWVEEKLPRPLPVLALSCEAPTESPVFKTVTVCNTLTNQGELSEQMAILSMPVPLGVKTESLNVEADSSDSQEITWKFEKLAAGEQKSVCATFSAAQPGALEFKSAAVGNRAAAVTSQCATRVFGVPAVLLEVIDLKDPIKVGDEVTYVIRVLNQGTLPLTNVKVVAGLETAQRYLSGSGASEISLSGDLITPALIPVLEPKQEIEWRIIVKAEQTGDIRFNVGLHADQFNRAIMETEATFQY